MKRLREIFNRLFYALTKEQEKRDSLKELFNAYQRESLTESSYFLKEKLNLEFDEKLINDINSDKLHSTKKENINRKSSLLTENNTTLLNSYRNAILPKKGAITLFSDNIPKGMNIKGINKQVKGCRIYIKTFPGAKSNQLNHYELPTLEKYSYDAAIIHVGINGILRSKDPNDLNDLPENVIKVGKICRNHNIGKIFMSGITPSTRANVDTSNINKKLRELSKKN